MKVKEVWIVIETKCQNIKNFFSLYRVYYFEKLNNKKQCAEWIMAPKWHR